jgi:ABC-type ATPase involved in cell division
MQPQMFDCSLEFSGTLYVYGSSHAGKSTLVLEIIQRREEMFNYQNIEFIYYVYTSWQSKFNIITDEVPAIKFVASYTDVPVIIQSSIIVFDDHQLIFQTNAAAELYVTDIFQRKVHHKNLFCVSILQTIHINELRSLALKNTY